MFKVKNKNTRTTGIFIVNFEQVNAGWETDKGYSKKQIVKDLLFSTPMRTQNVTMGSKCSENRFFQFFLPLVIYLSGFDLLNMSYFS